MPVLKIHHTSTSDATWDGNKNKTNLKTGADKTYYQRAFAWQDPDGDPTTKKAWKFIHHFVAGDGTIGAASTRGCQFGISVLNGNFGGADIPDADRQGVWDHLAAHLKDAKIEPAELKSGGTDPRIEFRSGPEVERRILDLTVHALRNDSNRQPEIDGMAAVYNQEAVIAGLFREVIRPGAFKRVLSENPDVVGCPNHNWDLVLGRSTAGTLKLTDQAAYGLNYKIKINPKDQAALDFWSRVERGDIQHSSFAFTVRKDVWTQPQGKTGLPLREIFEIDSLYDVSPVTFPAYPTTTAGVRSKAQDLRAGQAASGGAEGRLARQRARRRWLELQTSKYR